VWRGVSLHASTIRARPNVSGTLGQASEQPHDDVDPGGGGRREVDLETLGRNGPRLLCLPSTKHLLQPCAGGLQTWGEVVIDGAV
jgi:hypothetical protein